MIRRWLLFPVLFVFFQYGCVGRQIVTPLVPEPESRTVAASFFDMLERQHHCGCCLDAEAEVTLSVSQWLGSRSVTISGYLQAMAPSFLKFVGVNPLGQPHFILVTDGRQFQWVVVPDARVYIGQVTSEAFLKYSPAGFNPEGLYFWLSGQLPTGPLAIREIRYGERGTSYWLDLEAEHYRAGRVLFDPDSATVLQRILEDGNGKILLAVDYENYLEVDGCLRPGKVRIEAPMQNSGAVMMLSDFIPDSSFSTADFAFKPPPGFNLVFVK